MFVTYRGGNNHKPAHFYAERHAPKPAVHHKAPAVHHKAPAVNHKAPAVHHEAQSAHRHATAPAPHNGKPAVANNDRHGSDRHMAQNTNRSNGGHFGRR